MRSFSPWAVATIAPTCKSAPIAANIVAIAQRTIDRTHTTVAFSNTNLFDFHQVVRLFNMNRLIKPSVYSD